MCERDREREGERGRERGGTRLPLLLIDGPCGSCCFAFRPPSPPGDTTGAKMPPAAPNGAAVTPDASSGGVISLTSSMTSSVIMRPGDWLCAGCGAHNFAKRVGCFKCHTLRDVAKAGGATATTEPTVAAAAAVAKSTAKNLHDTDGDPSSNTPAMLKDEVLTVHNKMDTGWCVVPPAFFFASFRFLRSLLSFLIQIPLFGIPTAHGLGRRATG